MHWRSRKLTFVVIPEANSRVRRLRIPRLVLLSIGGAAALAIVLTAVWLYGVKASYTHAADALHREIEEQEAHFQELAQSKDRTIEIMQQHMIDLNEEATQIRNKLEELQQLETDVKKLSKLTVPSSPPIAGSGIGGQADDPSKDHTLASIETTLTNLENVHDQMTDISERLAAIKSALEAKEYLQQTTPDRWPLASRKITSGFGIRNDPFTTTPSFHSGYDIAGSLNDPVYATAQGTVTQAGWDDQFGNYILIYHAQGMSTKYMHLNHISVKKGEAVVKGQLIGLVGSTGRSTGNHLHYEVQKNGTPIDPRPFLP